MAANKQIPKPAKKMGRPEKPIDWRQVDALCQIQCTQLEICAVLEVSDETLNARCKKERGMTFLEYFKQKREGGKASLRRKQWKMADTSAAMAIFLGKNMLDQKDKQDIEHSGKDGGPLQVTVTVVNKQEGAE